MDSGQYMFIMGKIILYALQGPLCPESRICPIPGFCMNYHYCLSHSSYSQVNYSHPYGTINPTLPCSLPQPQSPKGLKDFSTFVTCQ